MVLHCDFGLNVKIFLIIHDLNLDLSAVCHDINKHDETACNATVTDI